MDNTVFGVIGNASSLALYLSPLPTILRIYKNKSTDELHPYQYIAGILNCSMSVVCAINDPYSSMLLTINSIGLLLYTFYLITFLTNSTDKRVAKALLISALVIIANGAIVFTTLIYVQNTATIAKVADILGIVFTISLYASPLTIVFDVFKTESVEFLPFWVGLAGFVNGCVWTTYGTTTADFNLLVGNGVGALFSAFQLLLHVVYSVDFKLDDIDTIDKSDDIDHVKTPLLMEMV